MENFQLFALITTYSSVAIAIAGLIMCIIFEVQCNRIEKQIEEKRKTLGFSDHLNWLLDSDDVEKSLARKLS